MDVLVNSLFLRQASFHAEGHTGPLSPILRRIFTSCQSVILQIVYLPLGLSAVNSFTLSSHSINHLRYFWMIRLFEYD